MEKSFDGNFSLQELQNTLITEEQLGFVLLTNLKKREQLPSANIGTFKDDAGSASPRPLILIEVPGGDPATIVAGQLQSEHHLICCEQVFVSGVEKKIAAFR